MNMQQILFLNNLPLQLHRNHDRANLYRNSNQYNSEESVGNSY